MSDDRKESDSVGPDIDLEKLVSDGSSEAGDDAPADAHDDSEPSDASGPEGGKLHEADAQHGADEHHEDHHDEALDRSTAPQSDFSTRQVAIGAAVTIVGIAVAYLVPGLLG